MWPGRPAGPLLYPSSSPREAPASSTRSGPASDNLASQSLLGGLVRIKPLLLTAAVLAIAGCSATSPAPAAQETSAAKITSAPGDTPGSIVVLKNYFFNNYRESCDGWSITGSTADFVTYGECPGTPAYFWLFDSPEQRDKLLPEIVKKDMPLLVSDKWVIAANMDLKPAQKDIGGAINP